MDNTGNGFLYLIKAACRYYVSAQGHILGAQMERDMRQDLFEKFQKLSFSYYDEHNTGAMMSRVVSDLLILRNWPITVRRTCLFP